MILLGLLLVLLAGAAAYLLVIGVSSLDATIAISVPLGTINLPPLALLLTGMAVISLFWLGWVLLRTGIKRGARARREAKETQATLKAEAAAAELRARNEVTARESAVARERQIREEEAARFKADADARVAEQHLATETARARAEVAENRLKEQSPS